MSHGPPTLSRFCFSFSLLSLLPFKCCHPYKEFRELRHKEKNLLK